MTQNFDFPRMPVRSALEVLTEFRDDQTIVVTNQGSARVWPLLAQHPLDFHYNPSTMGGAVPFALGLALAKPELQIVVISGDGALMMSLGSLVSVVASKASNVTVVVLNNGIYEVTGGQTIAAQEVPVDYVSLARSVGFESVYGFADESTWASEVKHVLDSSGPRFVSLNVHPALSEDMRTMLPGISERMATFATEVRK